MKCPEEPHTIHRIDKKLEHKILQLRKQHRHYPARIKEILQNQYKIKIGHMTVYQILFKNGPNRPRLPKSRIRRKYTRLSIIA
jgi:superfamily II helicase